MIAKILTAPDPDLIARGIVHTDGLRSDPSIDENQCRKLKVIAEARASKSGEHISADFKRRRKLGRGELATRQTEHQHRNYFCHGEFHVCFLTIVGFGCCISCTCPPYRAVEDV